jgi:thymidylate synthase (FAD)
VKETSPIETNGGGKQFVLPGYEEEVAKIPQRLLHEVNETKRPISPGAEKRLGEVIPVLDHGFVYLVDYLGNDKSIEDAARVSYGTGTRKVSETKGLIRYLMRHEHTTPFEMVELKFHAKMPIFVARQWVRHRTANINEYSARYSVMKDEFYIPEPDVISIQSTDNKQGRGLAVDTKFAKEVRLKLSEVYKSAHDLYDWLLSPDGGDVDQPGIARELARIPMPLAAYTEWYWKIDLHNCFKFLNLRMDKHAQWEIRQYADAMGTIIQDALPLAWEAFVDYQLKAVRLTRLEKEVLLNILRNREPIKKEEIIEAAARIGLTNKRERSEMLEKFDAIGLMKEK